MELTIKEILELDRGLSEIMEAKLPIKASYKIMKNKKALESEVSFFSDSFRQIVDEYAERNENGMPKVSEDGRSIIIKEDFIEECNTKIQGLEQMVVEVQLLTLEIEELGDLDLTPSQIGAIFSIIEE